MAKKIEAVKVWGILNCDTKEPYRRVFGSRELAEMHLERTMLVAGNIADSVVRVRIIRETDYRRLLRASRPKPKGGRK